MSCNVCSHPRVEEIDSAIAEGKKSGVISCMFGPTRADIEEHMQHWQQSTARASADLVGRLRKVERQAWDLVELALHSSKKPNIAGACAALREVRGVLALEAELLPPIRGQQDQQSIELILKAELRGNPQLVRAAVAQLPSAELSELLRTSATAAEVIDAKPAELPKSEERNCKAESAEHSSSNDSEELRR